MLPYGPVTVVCDQYGTPSREAYQELPGVILGASINNGVIRYAVRIDYPGDNWVITGVEDESLLSPLH